MADDIVSELTELHRSAARLQGLIAAAEASAPRQAKGTDATGALRATVGADGLPTALWVQDRWQRWLSAERLGPAVVEAFAAAADARMAAWNSALNDSDWPSTVDAADTGPAPAVPAPPVPAGNPPRLDELLNDMVSAFEHIDDLSATSRLGVEGSGTSGYNHLTVRVSPAGLTGCTVDGPWATQQPADTVMDAFEEALGRAKADLAVRLAAPGPAADLDRVLDGALALLNDPRRLS
jgi:hypothetical protein